MKLSRLLDNEFARVLLPISLAAAFIGFSAGVNAVTIVNNSFEDITGMNDNGTFANGVPAGWSFTGTKVQALQSPPNDPSGVDGSYFIEIFNSSDLGTLSQNITGLTVGQEYELSFLWGNRTLGYDFKVEMDGSSFSQSGTGLVNMIAESFTFTATATNGDLNITWNECGVGCVSGGALDAFVLNEVPIPPALWLFGSGLLGMIGIARRKK